jgi:hypothetical protein
MAVSQEKIDKSAHSDQAKKKKASTDHAAERGHQDDGKIAKHNDELAAKRRNDAETLKHKDELAKHHGDRQPSRDNDQWASKHHDNVRHEDNFHEHRKHDHYNSHGDNDALIGTGIAVGISALHELNKPKETVYTGVPVTSEKSVKTTKAEKHSQKSSHLTKDTSDPWSTIDPVRKDLSEAPR